MSNDDQHRQIANGQDLYELLIEVRHKDKIADPEGSTINKALAALGFDNVNKVSVGKAIRIKLTAANDDDALAQAEKMCQRLLSNPVLEDYKITILRDNAYA